MKPSSPKTLPGTVDRQTAWGCCTANLALPGSGSVTGGRRVGYFQMGLAVAGLGVSLWSGARFILWSLQSLHRFYDPATDPVVALQELWRAARWPLLGLGIFAVAWMWALVTSLSLMHSARAGGPAATGGLPPPPTGSSSHPPEPSQNRN
jgi:hypothetical protein